MLTYRKKHLCMSLKSQLCEVENRCRCFPTNLTTAPLLSSALSHCHRAPACVSLHFLALCCAVFPAITCSCISRIWYIYKFTLRKLPSSLRCSFQVTILHHFLLIAQGCQQSFCMSWCPFFFFFFFSPNGKYQFGIGDLISLLSCISSGSDVSAESDHFKLNSKGSSGDMSALCSSSPSLKGKVFPMLVFFFSCKYMTAVDLWGRLE